MVKQKSSSTKAKNQTSGPSLHGIFQRWLIAGLLAITFYLVAVLINAVYVKAFNSIDTTSGVVVSILIILAIVSGVWWLIESASGLMLYITRHSKPARKAAAKKK